MRSLAASFLCCFALSFAPACGGGSTSTGGTGGAASTSSSSTTEPSSSSTSSTGTGGSAAAGSLAEDYCKPLAALLCKRAASCGCGEVLPAGTLDEGACTAAYADKCLAAYAQLTDEIAAGKARIMAGAAADCIALLDASTPGCEAPRGVVAQALCPPWFTAEAEIGESCDLPFCAGGSGACVGGSCVARLADGDACASAPICVTGLVCSEGVCASPAASGTACSEDFACAPPLRCVEATCRALGGVASPCATDEGCELGLVCQAGACAARAMSPCDAVACGHLTSCAVPKRCIAKGTSGAACAGDDACAAGFACDAATHACVTAPGDGQPCANGVLCAIGLACDQLLGTCAPLPTDGELCALGPLGPFLCADPLGCRDDGTCGPLPGDGATCTIDSRCAAGLGCDFSPNGSICVPLRDQGGACQTDRTCKPGLYCDYTVNVCAPIRPAGSPCKDGNECGPLGVCVPDAGASFHCAPLPELGEACLFDCAAGLACVGDASASVCFPEICNAL